jgi:FMN phosphatase YigB (HAD superfamily)
MVFSGKVGVSKPDHGKYVEFIKRADVLSTKILFIDDKLENLKSASGFGIKTVLYDRGKEQGGFIPDLIIKSFKELMSS